MLNISYDGNPSDLIELGKAISDQAIEKEKETISNKSESIIFKFKIDQSGIEAERTASIPITNENLNSNFYMHGLRWIVDWGDGIVESYDHFTECSISHVYATRKGEEFKEKEYTVTISYDESSDEPMFYGWASCIRPYYTNDHPISHFKNLSHIIQVPYKSQAKSETDTGDYYMAQFSKYCDTLEYVYDEYLPNTVTRIGHHFRSQQYYGCTKIETPAVETLPSSVKYVGRNFRSYMYGDCSNLTETAPEVFSNDVTYVEDDFRSHQYQNCTKIKTPANEDLPTGLTTIGLGFRTEQYGGCIGLTVSADEVLPLSVDFISNGFRHHQYSKCVNLESIGTKTNGSFKNDICPDSYKYYGCKIASK
jgi:hypothetical protein